MSDTPTAHDHGNCELCDWLAREYKADHELLSQMLLIHAQSRADTEAALRAQEKAEAGLEAINRLDHVRLYINKCKAFDAISEYAEQLREAAEEAALALDDSGKAEDARCLRATLAKNPDQGRQPLASTGEASTTGRGNPSGGTEKPSRVPLTAELAAALRAMIVMSYCGPKPTKLDAALTWRQNDEKARALADAALAKYEAAKGTCEEQIPNDHEDGEPRLTGWECLICGALEPKLKSFDHCEGCALEGVTRSQTSPLAGRNGEVKT